MIVSHSRRFIFIKTVKSASTSLEMALSKYCAPGDILTPLDPREEAQRRAIAGIGAQGHLKPVGEMGPAELVRYLTRRNRLNLYKEHSTAWQVRDLVGEATWSDYFTFSVVRHPFDRCVSRFFYTRHYEVENGQRQLWDGGSFDQFLRYRTDLINENWRMLTERDNLLVDFVAHFENLERDLLEVSARLGLKHNIYDDMRDIKAKGGIRPNSAGVAQELSQRHRDLIALLCEKEMEAFGYTAGARPDPGVAQGDREH